MLFVAFIPALLALPTLGALIDKQYAHLIVPLNKSQEYTPMGTQKSFDIEREVSTLFLFDVPDNNAVFCNLKLTINTDPARGAPYKVWGHTGEDDSYVFNVSTVARHINKDKDTWHDHPEPKDWVATFTVWRDGRVKQEGGWYFACAKNNIAEYIAHAADVSKNGGFTIYELWDPPHGFTYEGFLT